MRGKFSVCWEDEDGTIHKLSQVGQDSYRRLMADPDFPEHGIPEIFCVFGADGRIKVVPRPPKN